MTQNAVDMVHGIVDTIGGMTCDLADRRPPGPK